MNDTKQIFFHLDVGIDQLVALRQLYGLTEEEIAIVEGKKIGSFNTAQQNIQRKNKQ